MEIKVNDYVRTKQGLIGKLKYTGLADFDSTPYYIETRKRKNWINKCNIIKSSPRIIDLIEVGDYVNGKEIEQIIDNELYFEANDMASKISFKEKDIKSIVTKEQFEQMEYKVGE